MDAQAITKALGGKWQGSFGLCRCPVHADRTPSLKVRDDSRKDDGIDLHCFAGCDWKDIKDEFKRRRFLPEFAAARIDPTLGASKETLAPPVPTIVPDDASKLTRAENIWRSAKPLPGTLGWRYFTERRSLHIELVDVDRVLRWHEGLNAVVALMTTPIGNVPCGVHRTFLNRDGTKRERKMLGKQGIVRVSPDEDVTHGLGLAEGVEDALAVLISGWTPVWAATSAGAIERFPVLGGIEFITIFADNDETGRNAAYACAARWTEARREARTSILEVTP
jgi:putative DNA primase/helicase